ncbi:MAG: hypothetical protein IJQ39_10140 [Thermoguttaceae bacterium]|nr:hypothetical protein [Thermoguttaceae bacterium]
MIDILYLTGEFIEKNGKTYNWSKILASQGVDHSVIMTRRAFLNQNYYGISPDLLQQDFEIRSAENEDYSLAIDAISEASGSSSKSKRTFVIPSGQIDLRPLLKQLYDKISVIVLANQSAPPDLLSLCQKWINLSDLSDSDIEILQDEIAEEESNLNSGAKPELKGVLEPNEVFWKDKISKSLPSFIQARQGVVDVSDVIQWLYSLQFNVDINEIQQEQIAADVRGKAILKQCLPAAYMWEEAPGIPTRIKDSRIKDIQTVSAAEAISMLQFGSKVSTPDPPPTTDVNLASAGTSTDINHIIIGADLMVHHCRWAVQREELVRQKADYQTEIAPMDNDFIRQGKEAKILIWTIGSPLDSDEAYNRMEKCYTTLLTAFRFLKQVEESCPEGMDGKNLMGRVAQLAADSQCILKTELRAQGKEVTKDPIQSEAFRYLREMGNREHLYLYNIKSQDEMPLDKSDDIISEVTMLQEQFYSINSECKQKKNLLGKVSYHAKQILGGAEPREQWEKIIAAATELSVDYSVPPSDLFFRQQLEGILDTLPEDLEISDEFGRIVQEIEIHQARVRESEELEAFGSLLPEDVLSPAVEKVREMYGNTIMVFIGGEPKEHIIRRIEDRFNVKLIWNSTNHSDSLNRFDGELSDPDVTLFLIYIPWCSHKHSEELAQIVQRAGKKLVRLRKGTNPDVIAEAICNQTDKSETSSTN